MNNFFLIIGAQKAGTTSLYDLLVHHEGINLANVKETQFFFDDDRYSKGISYYKSRFFSEDKKGMPYLDIDPHYMLFDFIPSRIYETLGPDVKLIVILRDPAQRAYSNYTMSLFRRMEDLSFDEAILREQERTKTSEGKIWNAYISGGFYFQQLSKWMEIFAPEQFHFILFEEDFIKKKEETLERFCNFLNVAPITSVSIEKRNPARTVKSKVLDDFLRGNKLGPILSVVKRFIPAYDPIRNYVVRKLMKLNVTQKGIPPLSEEKRRGLIQKYFLEDINQLEKLINRDLSCWK